MRAGRVVAIAMLWALSLVGVSVWAQDRQPGVLVQSGEAYGPVLTGAETGFQRTLGSITGDRQKVQGRWVVKVDGQWWETQPPVIVRRVP